MASDSSFGEEGFATSWNRAAVYGIFAGCSVILNSSWTFSKRRLFEE